MSELKSRFIDDTYCEYYNTGKHDLAQIYLKSEADKVIAEKENKLQNVSELLKETREWLIESLKLHKRCADNAIKQLRHNKYKRGLAMAKYCHESAMWLEENGVNKSAVFMLRWEKRWLELAEKFKEAK